MIEHIKIPIYSDRLDGTEREYQLEADVHLRDQVDSLYLTLDGVDIEPEDYAAHGFTLADLEQRAYDAGHEQARDRYEAKGDAEYDAWRERDL